MVINMPVPIRKSVIGKEFPEADASILCTALEGDINKDPRVYYYPSQKLNNKVCVSKFLTFL